VSDQSTWNLIVDGANSGNFADTPDMKQQNKQCLSRQRSLASGYSTATSQRSLLLTVLVLFVTAINAPATPAAELTLVGERPNAAGPPTEVSVSLYVLDIDSIDDVDQRFSVDMFLNVAWQDERLALPEGEEAGKVRTVSLDDIWTPRGLIVNDRGLSQQLPRAADIDDLGNVQYRQRLIGDLAVKLDLKEFPFDTQYLPIQLVSYQYSPDELSLASVGVALRENGNFSAGGWRFSLLTPETGELTVRAAQIARPQLTYLIQAQRETNYYLVTMLLPISLIVFMAWTAFWLQPNVVPSRIAISTASIFSLIAFGLSIRLRLPPVSYTTRADIFVIGSMLLVFMALGVAVIGSRWANSEDRMDQALTLNAITRWAYVGLFLVIVCVAIFI